MLKETSGRVPGENPRISVERLFTKLPLHRTKLVLIAQPKTISQFCVSLEKSHIHRYAIRETEMNKIISPSNLKPTQRQQTTQHANLRVIIAIIF